MLEVLSNPLCYFWAGPKLGQHFLSDTRFRRRISDALNVHADDLVIEIGAGRGAMTGLLAERAWRVVAIELDAVLAQKLKEKLSAEPRIEILEADILTVDIARICRRYEVEKCVVFGNLPYYITSPIIHHLFSFRSCIRAMVLLVQREVAMRLVAEPRTRAYGYLSVLTELYSRPSITLRVPPGAFSPPPQIHSALVGFEMRARFPEGFEAGEGSALPTKEKTEARRALLPGATHALPPLIEDAEKFLDFVKLCFAQKRKNLLNNLGGTYSRRRVERALEDLGWPLTLRAEQLAIEQFATLFQRLA